ncbi:MAG: esterase-like activity of phytase family protein [Flavobacteriaceae bacterium]|nr:esterase-like activity of phytase family protein [Flavobacteriaceae bacterium]
MIKRTNIRFINTKTVAALFAAVFIFFGCKSNTPISVSFLDEYIIKDSLLFNDFIVGGLSGLNYANNKLYFVVDDAKNPRVLEANLILNNNKIKSIDFTKIITIQDSTNAFYKNNVLDLEDIFVDENTQEMVLISEGSINYKYVPSVFKTNLEGKFAQQFTVPKHFTNFNNIKHNGVFEGVSKSIDNKGFWVAMESPLKSDGEEPTFTKTTSPIRITYYSNSTNSAEKQYTYLLDSVTMPPKGNVNLNGVTAILQHKKDAFLILERGYQSGYGPYGNTIRLYEAIISKNTKNTLWLHDLKDERYQPLKKRLLLDFNTIKSQLTEGIIDNLEGISYGPTLENGNASLLLIADDNFQVYGKQLNQLILLEIK